MRRFLSLFLALAISACAHQNGEVAAQASGTIRIASAAESGVSDTPRVMARLDADTLIARDGAALPLRRWMPEAAPRAVVLALHGYGDYSHAFAGAGTALAAEGIAVYAYDQRGFGRAPGPGRWFGSDRLVDDAVTAVGLLRDKYPGVPVYLLGESMGGAVAILAAGRVRTAGTILVAPAVWGRAEMNVFERAGLWLADLVPGIEWSPRLIPMKISPSDNMPMLVALGRDPLVLKTSRSDALNGLVDLMGSALHAGSRFTAPALILYGEKDQIVPRPPVADFVSTLPASARAEQRFALYANGYHMLLRDLEGAMVIRDVAAWINDPTAPLPSGADRGARDRLLGRKPPLATAAR